MKLAFMAVVGLLAGGVLSAEVSNVTIRQDWPWSDDVKVTYELSGASTDNPVELVITTTSEGQPVAITPSAWVGETCSITENGTRTLHLDVKKAFRSGAMALSAFKVDIAARPATAASTEVLYRIFDLDTAKVTDVTRGELLNGKYGSVETDFGAIGPGYKTTLDDVVIWTGVTNDIAYKTTKLVVRRIPAGSFKGYKVGATPPKEDNMSFSFDYWIGVFEMTRAQATKIGHGSRKDSPELAWTNTIPTHRVQNYDIYGAGTVRNGTTNRLDLTTGILPNLRKKFKVGDDYPYDFELPSQTQWVRAMRAGADGYYYDGCLKPVNLQTNDEFAALGKYLGNGGMVENPDGSISTNMTVVGQFRPNAYGLYDMLGNVREATRDVSEVTTAQWTTGGEDLCNAGTGNPTWFFGSAFNHTASEFSFGHNIQGSSSSYFEDGFRVCVQAMDDGVRFWKTK